MHAYVCARVLCLLGARTRDATLVGALGRSIGHCRGRGLDRRPIGYRVCTPRTIAPMMHAAHTQAAAASIIVWPGSFNSFTPGPHNHTHASNPKKKKARQRDRPWHGGSGGSRSTSSSRTGRRRPRDPRSGCCSARRRCWHCSWRRGWRRQRPRPRRPAGRGGIGGRRREELDLCRR